jgi:hypothetical protein
MDRLASSEPSARSGRAAADGASSGGLADVPVTVTVGEPLAGAVLPVADEAACAVAEHLAAVLADLGLPARPAVQVRVDAGSGADEPVRIDVAGRPCRFPSRLLPEVLAYVDGAPGVAGGDALAELGGERGGRERSDAAPDSRKEARLTQFLGLLTRTAVSAQSGLLWTEPVAARTVQEIGIDGTAVARDGGAALATAVRLGMPVTPTLALRAALSDAAAAGDAGERLLAAVAPPTVDICVNPDYLPEIATIAQDATKLSLLREDLFGELGLPVPSLHLRPDPGLGPRAFAFRVNGLRTLPQLGLAADQVLVNETADRLALFGTDAVPTLNPATGQLAALVTGERGQALPAMGFTTWDAWEYVVLSLATALRQRGHTRMTTVVAAALLEQLSRAYPAVTAAASQFVPLDVLAPVLRELLSDGVPIRHLRRIVELLLRYQTAGPGDGEADRVTVVRSGMADIIATTFSRGTATLVVYLLAPEFEHLVRSGAGGTGAAGAGSGTAAVRLLGAVRDELATLPPTASVPVVLTRDDLRRQVAALLRAEFPHVRVVGHGDLPANHNVQPFARIVPRPDPQPAPGQ